MPLQHFAEKQSSEIRQCLKEEGCLREKGLFFLMIGEIMLGADGNYSLGGGN